MKSVVIYGTRFGNTQKIAEAIVDGLRSKGDARLVSVDDRPEGSGDQADLVVIGGPTEKRGVTEPVAQFLDHFAASPPKGVRVALFDTRLRQPRWLSGSAAHDMEKKLRRVGAHLLIAEESFLVRGSPAALEPGELERAAVWGRSLAEKLTTVTELPSK